jgi:hypothetical protein
MAPQQALGSFPVRDDMPNRTMRGRQPHNISTPEQRLRLIERNARKREYVRACVAPLVAYFEDRCMDPSIRVVVGGGRRYGDARLVTEVLDACHAKYGISELVQGGAKGADRLALRWALTRDVPYATFPANWNKYGRGAGPIRNREMIETEPDMVIVFPGGKGTANLCEQARRKGIRVVRITRNRWLTSRMKDA